MARGQAEVISIEPLQEHEQFIQAVELQKQIWQFDDIELLPVRLFVVATKIGGQAFGAFEGGRMVGFALAIPGMKAGPVPYLHSHMVGVALEYRDRGVGRMLKLTQREDALARGVELMEWTFDPLELKNARFNIEKLGAIVRRYVPNQYGQTTSTLHGGLPTDRCTAEWWMRSARVSRAVSGEAPEAVRVERRVAVPLDIAGRAREVQASMAAAFTAGFAAGLTVIGFELTATAGEYLLGRWE